MTKGEGSVHLSSCYKGLRELYAEREANDPSIHVTNCGGRNKSPLCHPERSRGICSSLMGHYPFASCTCSAATGSAFSAGAGQKYRSFLIASM
jgi:hypothetical protein